MSNWLSKESWSEIVEALSAKPFRTLLTAFGVFWGIFILVVLLSASKGLENGVKKDFRGIATNSMFVWAMPTAKPYKGYAQGRQFNYVNKDVEILKSKMPELRLISPRLQLGGHRGTNTVVRGTTVSAYTVYGDAPEFILQEPMDIRQGRFINHKDMDDKRKVAVIGEGVVEELFEKNENPIGEFITINSVNFKVVGVYYKESAFGNPETNQKKVFLPFTTFQQVFNMQNVVGWMALTAIDEVPITSIKEKIKDILKKEHSIHPDDKKAIGNFDLFEKYNQINGLFDILQVIAYFVGTLVLLSGIIGVSNIMLIVVKERTKEIGIRRAIGAAPSVIRGQILLESLVLTLIASMVGVILSAVLIWAVNGVLDNDPSAVTMFINPSVNLSAVIVSLMLIVLSGLLAGLLPAQIALKIRPIDALRDE